MKRTHDARGRRLRDNNDIDPVIAERTEPSKRDKEMFAQLYHFRYLPTTYLSAILDRHQKYLMNRLAVLKPAGYVYYPETLWLARRSMSYRPAVVGLTRKAKDLLHREEMVAGNIWPSRPGGAPHDAAASLVEASLYLGAPEYGIVLELPRDIFLASPESTQRMDNPFALDTTFEFPIEDRKQNVVDVRIVRKKVYTDGHFLGLNYNGTVIYLPGFEMDMGTEGGDSNDPARSSIKEKILAFRQLLRDEAYVKQFGFNRSSFPFLFIAAKKADLAVMMAYFDRLTNGAGSQRFWFTCIPELDLKGPFPPPNGWIYRQKFLRVGHPPITILEALGVPIATVAQSENAA